MTAVLDRPGTNALSVLKLHFTKREIMLVVPLYITLMVGVVTVIVSLAFQRAGSVPGSADFIDGSRSNGGMAWGLVGFLIYLGIQSIGTTFPFGMSLGATRRNYVLGSALTYAVSAAYLTALFTVMLAIELLTDHFFIGVYVFDVYVLGAGDFGAMIPIVFLGTLTAYSVGSVFGAAWVRFGNRGPILMGLGLGLLLAIALLVLVPYAGDIARAFQAWWLAALAVVVVLVSLLGTLTFLTRASVR